MMCIVWGVVCVVVHIIENGIKPLFFIFSSHCVLMTLPYLSLFSSIYTCGSRTQVNREWLTNDWSYDWVDIRTLFNEQLIVGCKQFVCRQAVIAQVKGAWIQLERAQYRRHYNKDINGTSTFQKWWPLNWDLNLLCTSHVYIRSETKTIILHSFFDKYTSFNSFPILLSKPMELELWYTSKDTKSTQSIRNNMWIQ